MKGSVSRAAAPHHTVHRTDSPVDAPQLAEHTMLGLMSADHACSITETLTFTENEERTR